jgi:TonB-linked SusC/RagA family outer membrane protein
MKKRSLLLALMAMLITTMAWSQRNVTGTVSDSDGDPVIGATVKVQNTTRGAITGLDGEYSIQVNSDNEVLEFSFIGYTTKLVPVGNQTVVNVTLEEDQLQLSEVVVTAFGIAREKKALSYSVQEIGGDALERAGTTNLTNALQGKIAGVQVNQSSGMPGASSFMRVRGSNSLNLNNQPLFIVDGSPVASGPTTSGGVSGADYSHRALDINIDDIESVSVLKGASAAALYGLRASNGVVIITTKQGKRDMGRPQVSISQSFTFDQASRFPDLQNTYSQGAGGQFNIGASTSWGPKVEDLADPSINPRANGDGTYTNLIGQDVIPQKYDNISPMFQTGVTSTTSMNVLGSIADRGSFALSMAYTGQDGIIPTTGMARTNLRLSSDYDLTNKIRVGASANVVKTDIDKLAGGSNLSNVLFTTYWAPISYDLWGLPFATADNPYAQIHYRGAMDNPRWALENNSFNENISRTFGNAFVEYKPLSWLSARYQIGIDNYVENRKEVYGLGSGGSGGRTTGVTIGEDENGNPIPLATGTPGGGNIYDFKRNYQEINSNLSFSLDRRLSDDFSLFALLGNEIVDIQTNNFSIVGTGIQIGGFDNMSNTSNQTVSNTATHQRQVGTYVNATLDFRSAIYLNASLRTDVVSNMPRDNRTFTYPSAGIGFVFSEFMDLAPGGMFNFGKIRFSYAEVGQAGPLYPSSTPYVLTSVGTGFTNNGIEFPFAGVTAFQESNSLNNPNLIPQNTISIEAGLQLQFLRNRLGLDITYFSDRTENQIFRVPVPASTGFSTALQNAGELVGRGVELTITGTPVQTGSFTWDLAFNFTRIQNEVIELAEGVDNIFLGGFVEPNVRAQAGSAYPIIFGTRYLRDNDGNIVYDSRQFLGSGNPNPRYGMPIADPELGPVGNVNPDFEIGFSNNFSYGPFTLSAHIDMRQGGQMYAGNTRLQKLYGMDIITEDRETPVVMDGVKGYLDGDGELIIEGANDIAILRGQAYWSTYMDAITESNVYETSFFRLRELSLTYRLPGSIGALQNASISVNARNLVLLTSYPNFDPETSVGGAGNFQGLEYVNLPQARSFGVSLRAQF